MGLDEAMTRSKMKTWECSKSNDNRRLSKQGAVKNPVLAIKPGFVQINSDFTGPN